jgi:GR25 family glycosyltransferase involved in LPS biosynthesis
MKTIVITLKQEQERLLYIVNEIKRCNIENFYLMDAVYGKNITEHPLLQTNGKISKLLYNGKTRFYDSRLRLNGQGLNKGEMGCSWSHLDIYEMLLKDDQNDSYLIIEDDANIIVPPKEFHTFINKLPTSDTYDICHLFSSEWFAFNKITQVNSHFWIPERRFFNHTGAYIVTKQGAKKLLNAVYPCIGLPADDLLSNTYIFTNNFRVIVPYKTLVTSKGFKSSINNI